MKFGGTSVGNGERIKEAARIATGKGGKGTVVVTSAMSGVTDRLIGQAKEVQESHDEGQIKEFIQYLKGKHLKAAGEAMDPAQLTEVEGEIERLCNEAEKVFIGISYLGEVTPRSMDYIQSFGERLCAPILSGAIRSLGKKSMSFTGHEAGIITDSNFGKAKPIMSLTEENVNRIILPLLKDSIPVVTGFVAGDKDGRITTLSRGGSDYSAAILGSALNANEIWIWTDVDGILTTDPRMVPQAKIISEISYIEAQELAYFGAKVLHPRTIEPAMVKGIPVRIKNTFKPDFPGTLIVKEESTTQEVVKAISVLKGVVLLTISGVGMIGVPGVAARLFSALAKKKVNILMISQGSSEVNISLVIEGGDIERAIEAIKDEFQENNLVKDINYNEDIAVIAVVGSGMRGTKGVAARVFMAAYKADVNVLMIAQGSSEVNISFIVPYESAATAAEALHKEFIH